MRQNPFRKYRGFARGEFLNVLAYRFDIYSWVFQSVVSVAVLVFLWFAVYQEKGGLDTVINGYTYRNMIGYLVYSSLTNFWCLGASVSFNYVSHDIYEGNIAVAMTKPVNYRLKMLAGSFGNLLASFFLLFLPIYLIVTITLHYAAGLALPTYYGILLYLLSSLVAFVVNDCFEFMVGELAFFTSASFGLALIKDSLRMVLSGAALPLSFFPTWYEKVMQILPFAGFVSTPVNALLGLDTPIKSLSLVGIEVGWIVIFMAASLWTNKAMTKRVESVGG